jgi:hypothetical protein
MARRGFAIADLPGFAAVAGGAFVILYLPIATLAVYSFNAGESIALDLQKPVKVLADATSNSLILASTADNVRALEEAARLFDTLPVTDAAVVRVFPLDNIQATQFARIVRDLFTQGKQIGVLAMAWLASAIRIGAKPTDATWLEVYGVSLLCGVGFTMSLFIGALAFPGAIDSPLQVQVKLGVLSGSLVSGVVGAIVLSMAASRRKNLAKSSPNSHA